MRERLLPAAASGSTVPLSAFDEAWMDRVPADRVPFVSAMGLLMYFEAAQVKRLLTAVAERFPGAEIFFDAIPPLMSRKTLRGHQVTKGYVAPPMPWGISVEDLPGFLRAIPGLHPVVVQDYAAPYPSAMWPYTLLSKIGPIRKRLAPSLAHAAVRSDAA